MVKLVEELVEEILLRLPPGDPVSLLRAATVCRSWCRIISAPGFRRRFGQRHRTAPILGFLDNPLNMDYAVRFVPATPFRPRRPEHRDRWVLDSRHGRVLLTSMPCGPEVEVWELEVLDPVTDELRELPKLPLPSTFTWNAAVVCADYGSCDHLVCRRGPFLVVFLDDDGAKMRVHLYSSAAGAWSEPSYGPPPPLHGVEMVPSASALVGSALCFLIDKTNSILKYDLARPTMSVINLPPNFISGFKVLMTMGDGGLGFAVVEKSTLWVYSMETDRKGDDFWVPVRSIELETLLRVHAYSIKNDCFAFAPGVDVFFVGTEDDWLSI